MALELFANASNQRTCLLLGTGVNNNNKIISAVFFIFLDYGERKIKPQIFQRTTIRSLDSFANKFTMKCFYLELYHVFFLILSTTVCTFLIPVFHSNNTTKL